MRVRTNRHHKGFHQRGLEREQKKRVLPRGTTRLSVSRAGFEPVTLPIETCQDQDRLLTDGVAERKTIEFKAEPATHRRYRGTFGLAALDPGAPRPLRRSSLHPACIGCCRGPVCEPGKSPFVLIGTKTPAVFAEIVGSFFLQTRERESAVPGVCEAPNHVASGDAE
jgi:hypothetical protein